MDFPYLLNPPHDEVLPIAQPAGLIASDGTMRPFKRSVRLVGDGAQEVFEPIVRRAGRRLDRTVVSAVGNVYPDWTLMRDKDDDRKIAVEFKTKKIESGGGAGRWERPLYVPLGRYKESVAQPEGSASTVFPYEEYDQHWVAVLFWEPNPAYHHDTRVEEGRSVDPLDLVGPGSHQPFRHLELVVRPRWALARAMNPADGPIASFSGGSVEAFRTRFGDFHSQEEFDAYYRYLDRADRTTQYATIQGFSRWQNRADSAAMFQGPAEKREGAEATIDHYRAGQAEVTRAAREALDAIRSGLAEDRGDQVQAGGRRLLMLARSLQRPDSDASVPADLWQELLELYLRHDPPLTPQTDEEVPVRGSHDQPLEWGIYALFESGVLPACLDDPSYTGPFYAMVRHHPELLITALIQSLSHGHYAFPRAVLADPPTENVELRRRVQQILADDPVFTGMMAEGREMAEVLYDRGVAEDDPIVLGNLLRDMKGRQFRRCFLRLVAIDPREAVRVVTTSVANKEGVEALTREDIAKAFRLVSRGGAEGRDSAFHAQMLQALRWYRPELADWLTEHQFVSVVPEMRTADASEVDAAGMEDRLGAMLDGPGVPLHCDVSDPGERLQAVEAVRSRLRELAQAGRVSARDDWQASGTVMRLAFDLENFVFRRLDPEDPGTPTRLRSVEEARRALGEMAGLVRSQVEAPLLTERIDAIATQLDGFLAAHCRGAGVEAPEVVPTRSF